MLIGRENEVRILREAVQKENSQFIAVYGRRRVGKTFLIREAYDYKFAFQYTGAHNMSSRGQLTRFRLELKRHGLKNVPTLSNWAEAFYELKRFLEGLPGGKKVVFLDELPWMDNPRSRFLSELEAFWNGWASARKDIVLIVCGSATGWMVKKILKNKGGLHDRLSHRMQLKPFTLGLCEKMAVSQGIEWTRKQILDAYMILGGVPYYWSLLEKGVSVVHEIDRLIFSRDGELHDEFKMLYASLFDHPEPYLKIISALAKKKIGLTRDDLVKLSGISTGGAFSSILEDLEWCGFIRGYRSIGTKKNGKLYQLVDHFTIFYYDFIADGKTEYNYWEAMQGKPKYNTWCGLAFERTSLWHTEQIKKALGISGVLTEEYSWRSNPDNEAGMPGTQIDLLIDRSDGIIDLCEMKYSDSEYTITQQYESELRTKKDVFSSVTRTRKSVHIILVTTFGLKQNAYCWSIQKEVTLDSLFE